MVRDDKLLIANWKMNLPGEGIEDWLRLVKADRTTSVAVAPPFPYLARVAIADSGLTLVAQNCSAEREGAFTGEVSAAMLADVGVAWVILGHSERRHLFGESPQLIGRKVHAAQQVGLVPVVCVGEKEEIREEGKTDVVLQEQLAAALEHADRGMPLIVAYEPVWAIGTGKTATAEIILETHEMILAKLDESGFRDAPLLYGGSVTPDNAGELAALNGVSGFLVGGASLFSDRFLRITQALEQVALKSSKKG